MQSRKAMRIPAALTLIWVAVFFVSCSQTGFLAGGQSGTTAEPLLVWRDKVVSYLDTYAQPG